ncbi:MAG TPA: hypothetical protein VHO92_04470 [Methanobacterium sp.]|nr:hypothetical protein [Methanobacterium sp.]
MIQSVTVTTATITTEQALGLFIGIIIVLLIAIWVFSDIKGKNRKYRINIGKSSKLSQLLEIGVKSCKGLNFTSIYNHFCFLFLFIQ